MIGRLTGTLVAKQPPQVVVDCHGVGYELDVPMSTFYALPALGVSLCLLVHPVVREDAHLLFGFASEAERSAFRTLIKVSGVGPKVALAILSGLSVAELAQAVSLQDSARLTRVPGIGKKTAERLLLELKDKFSAAAAFAAPASRDGAGASASQTSDILNALLALGYNEREALGAMKTLPADALVGEGIRLALKYLARG